jgi:hypothetical protein
MSCHFMFQIQKSLHIMSSLVRLFCSQKSVTCDIHSHVTTCHVMSCHVMSCHVMSCHVMSCHVMSCHVMLQIRKSNDVQFCQMVYLRKSIFAPQQKFVDSVGEFHDQGDARRIVIRTSLWGHNDKPFRQPTPSGLSATRGLAALRMHLVV